MIKTKISSSFVRITTLLQLTTQYIRANPSEAIRVMSKIFDIGLAYPVPKVMKYVIKKMTKSVLVSVPISYTENIFSIVSLALKYLVSQFNCYSRISMLGRKDSSGYNIMEVNSEEFGRIRFSEWCEASEHYSVLNYKLSKYFMTFRNRQETFIQDIKSISVGRYYLKKVFNSVHKDLMCFVSSNLSILVASHVNLADIMLMLCENFMLEESSLEHLHNDTVFATIIAHFDLVSLLKSQNLSDHKKRQLEKFYMKTLKLGLNNFARNARFYYDGTFESEASLEKIEKKIDLGTRACRYLKIETFLEGNSPISKDLATFPKLFFDLNYYSLEGSKYKFKFQNKASKWNFSRSLVNSIGPLSNNSETIYHSVVYDCSAESKGILGSTQYSGKVANLKKILYYFCVVDVDAMRAFFKTDLGNLKFEYTMEDKGLGENEVKNLISTALEFGTNLAVNMMTKFMTMIPQLPALTNNIRDAIQKYHVFNYQFRYLIDYFIEKNLANTNILRNLFYWDTPQFPLLMKYVTTNYDKYKVLQVYFTKTMKRLDSDQLTYYLPQIYQIMNTKANYIVGETLRDYGKKSFLFSHQLIWKTKVETKREKGETEGGTLTSISKILLRKILKSMTPLEKSIFKQVDDFFESITAISGILRPKMPKPEKKSIIKENLEKIPLNDFLYIPSNPYYKIAKIKLDSGTPMQSAAKCPIMITFYCQKYEGPDSYYQRLIVSQQSVNSYTNDEDLAPENIQESTGINNLRETTGIKLFPKEKLNPWGIPTSFVRNHENAENRSFVLE